MTDYNEYEVVVGLEVHAQLLTQSKLFCGDSTAFDSEPNTNISPITLGHPGTLPKMNKKAIEFAVKMGLACNCEIEANNYFARKNYFYPDLPKGYQVSQHTTPICKGGFVIINTGQGEKKILLNRIHLEEDAGKSLHDADDLYTSIDYNRAGIPLIEIVSEPDMRSGDEAYAYVTEIRKLVRYLQVCNGNMEAGSLRCDANISVRKKGDSVLGTKVEIKNLNSIRHIKRAIEYEAKQLVDILVEGGIISQQTKSFDLDSGTTTAIRDKEDADDYRYFAEPDLAPFYLQDDFIESIRKSIPALQSERLKKYTGSFNLSLYDATSLTEDRETADYFEKVTEHTSNYKAAANWMLGPVKSWLNESGLEINAFPLEPGKIAALIILIDEGNVNFSIASSQIFPVLLRHPGKDPSQVAMEQNLLQQSDVSLLLPVIEQVLVKFPEKIKEYQKGKKGLMSLFVGEVMKLSKGKADPKLTTQLLADKLKSQSQ